MGSTCSKIADKSTCQVTIIIVHCMHACMCMCWAACDHDFHYHCRRPAIFEYIYNYVYIIGRWDINQTLLCYSQV